MSSSSGEADLGQDSDDMDAIPTPLCEHPGCGSPLEPGASNLTRYCPRHQRKGHRRLRRKASNARYHKNNREKILKQRRTPEGRARNRANQRAFRRRRRGGASA